ncbi:MAG: ribosome maturation factor RimM [Pseudomonadota bacterium]|nr:ribosome maturation factor RimM [Pseudomonadota bacterium]
MGRILGPYGVRGWMNLRTFTQHLDSLADYPSWLLADGDGWKPVEVEGAHVHGGHLVAKLVGVEDRDQAFALRGREVAIPREALPPAEDGEFYWADLVGLEVVNVQGEVLGNVEDLLETGANDVLVVQGDRQRLLPYVDAVVLDVDLAQRRIRVDWGLDY